MPDDFGRGCMIPLFQSIAAGLLAGLIVAGACYWLELSRPWLLAGVAAGCVAFWWFTGSINLWREDVYTPLYAAPPEPVEETVSTVKVEFHDEKQILFAELPATPAQLRELSKGLLSGVAFSEASWIGAGRPFTRSQFQGIRSEFIARGWLRQRSPDYPNQGYELSPAGRAVCRELSAKGRS